MEGSYSLFENEFLLLDDNGRIIRVHDDYVSARFFKNKPNLDLIDADLPECLFMDFYSEIQRYNFELCRNRKDLAWGKIPQ